MIALLDNTVISNFSFIRRPDFVRLALGDAVATVQAAFDEYNRGVHLNRLPACDWNWLPILELTADEASLMARFASELGLGEASCIACAVSRSLRIFTDDRDARRAALELHVPVSGTLGMLLLLVDAGILSTDEADRYLSQMIASGYRSPLKSLTELR
ncbi:MAG: hypothetical protein WAU00_10835 [Caldilinea sp.]|uniref:DUF3368 domain-containing protein n=1 Tax=Caldilinea sp. TaxID=2293560 RepID=UPI002C77B8A8|nr:DUF3368 domain-containing protein [Anaerolineales bacterium]HQY94333.1 hypothetical protein [Caldilinea sp.]HRA68205.1 hypothetical protein [Caldilinea sp.]